MRRRQWRRSGGADGGGEEKNQVFMCDAVQSGLEVDYVLKACIYSSRSLLIQHCGDCKQCMQKDVVDRVQHSLLVTYSLSSPSLRCTHKG